jgi:hypothetical protein
MQADTSFQPICGTAKRESSKRLMVPESTPSPGSAGDSSLASNMACRATQIPKNGLIGSNPSFEGLGIPVGDQAGHHRTKTADAGEDQFVGIEDVSRLLDVVDLTAKSVYRIANTADIAGAVVE